jgi:hypothetical protein
MFRIENVIGLDDLEGNLRAIANVVGGAELADRVAGAAERDEAGLVRYDGAT